MKKRVLSVILLLIMLFGLFPSSVQAANLIDVTITGRCHYSTANDIADLTISRRVQEGGRKLNYNKNLTEAAMRRAAEVAFYYSHTRPNGGRYYEFLKEYHKGYYYHGENIAIQMGSAESVTNAWFASAGHRNNIMNTKFTQMGVGVYSSGSITAYVQLFSDSKKDTATTTKTGSESRKYNISTEPSHLLRYTADLEDSYDLEINDYQNFYLKYVNDGYRYSTCSLVPSSFDIKDSQGTVIARLEELTDSAGYYRIVPKAVGTGTASVGAFKGDSNPTVLTVTVKDHEHVPDNNWIKSDAIIHDCQNKGYEYCYCRYCNKPVFYRWIDKLPHNYVEYVSVDHNSHKSACTMCGGERTESHDMLSNVIAPTCSKQGYTQYTCKKCDYSYSSDYTNMIAHSWGVGEIVVEPTYTAPGSMMYRCKHCPAEKIMSISPMNNPFIDVEEDSYYFQSVIWAVDKGVTTGTAFNEFGPDDTCTRAQAVTFLWRAAGEPEPKSSYNPFKDVNHSEYYYKAVLWAVENGITNGTSKNTFSPDVYCTRGQIVTFLWRANGQDIVSSNNPFIDVQTKDYYYDAVLWAVDNNITNGISDNRFAPDNNCTRAQIVTFLYRDIG